jgi:hypothetical protein
MSETNVVAAILTVAFYTGRGGAMGLPQIVATYEEMRALLAQRTAPKPPRKSAAKRAR